MSDTAFDFAIVGAGISGAAAAAELAGRGVRVLLLEAESSPGYHTTGRSAGLYTLNYGPPVVRKLTRLGLPLLQTPPATFCQQPLLSPAGCLMLSDQSDSPSLEAYIDSADPLSPVTRVSAAEARRLAPLVRPERIAAGAWEPAVTHIDVATLHAAFLRQAAAAGVQLQCDARVSGIQLGAAAAGQDCVIDTTQGEFRAASIVNAAGAWADEIAALAGVKSIGLQPRRRTVMTQPAHAGQPNEHPATLFIDEEPYLKCHHGQLTASLGEATPIAAQDVQPDELDLACLVDWLEQHTHVEVPRKPACWAGLRSFVADEQPVVGGDPGHSQFFWLAAQGGYGIMMASVLGRTCASLAVDGELPEDLQEAGISAAQLAPARAALAAPA